MLNRLRDLRLIDFIGPGTSPAIGAHPLLREYFAEQVRTQLPSAWQAGHQRLFQHLGGTTPYWPEGIEGLQPLYRAVAHGCRAGLYEQACTKVFRDRILRGTGDDGFYTTRRLGAIGADLGAVANFFSTPWTALAPTLTPAEQAWLLNEAAYSLRALGWLAEAVEPVRASIEMSIREENWKRAGQGASNLSELELTLGDLPAALMAGHEAVAYADRNEEPFWPMSSRTKLADVLHQAGRKAESQHLFEEAENRQAARQPRNPRLYSVWGFRYCDLLLSDVEREAWQSWMAQESRSGETLARSIAASDTVSERAIYALKIAEETRWLLDIALYHLILARAMFYKALMTSSQERQSAVDHVTAAVDRLRAAGAVSRRPPGLLTRAWMRCLSGDEPGAHADLDEAWEIAERGPMPLFQADIHLYRARLFRDHTALEEARRLIEKHGYHRRDGELADALAVAEKW